MSKEEKVLTEKEVRAIQEAEERLKSRSRIWKPEPGEMKAVEILGLEERESPEAGTFEVFELTCLTDGERLSIAACGFLRKHLKPGKRYILRYEGRVEATIKGEVRNVHQWSYEEIK